MLFGKKKSVAGLDVGSSSVKIVELDGKMNNLSLIGLGFENLPADTVVDGQIMELNTVSEVIKNICLNHQIDASIQHRKRVTSYSLSGNPLNVHLNGFAIVSLKYSINFSNCPCKSSFDLKLPHFINFFDKIENHIST